MLQRRALRGLLILLALSGVLAMMSCAQRGQKREVWAKVDGAPIYRSQVEAIYRTRQAALPENGRPEQVLSFKLAILNELIDRSLLLERASQLPITVLNNEVDTRLSQIRNPLTKDGFQKEIAGQGLTPSELRKQVQENLIIQKLIQREILSQVTVTADEVSAYYDHNKSDFNVPQAEVHLAQILVTPLPDPHVRNLMHDDARNDLEAQRKIQALYLQVRSGKDFAKVAEEYSEDPRTAPGGGDMGFIPVSSIASNGVLSRALKSLKPGQITGIIQDRAGSHIYRLLGRLDPGQRKLSDPGVQETIRKTLAGEKAELLKAAYIESLRNHARVVDYLAQEILQGHASPTAIR